MGEWIQIQISPINPHSFVNLQNCEDLQFCGLTNLRRYVCNNKGWGSEFFDGFYTCKTKKICSFVDLQNYKDICVTTRRRGGVRFHLQIYTVFQICKTTNLHSFADLQNYKDRCETTRGREVRFHLQIYTVLQICKTVKICSYVDPEFELP